MSVCVCKFKPRLATLKHKNSPPCARDSVPSICFDFVLHFSYLILKVDPSMPEKICVFATFCVYENARGASREKMNTKERLQMIIR